MRRATAVLGALAMVLATASVFAQKASFAGKWVMVPAADAPAGGGGGRGGRGGRGGFGQEFSIEQTDKTITIVRTGQDGTQTKQLYNIGGDTKMMMGGRGGEGGTEVVVKTAWQGNDLVITTPTQNGERTQVLSIKEGNLVITTTNPGREGGPAQTTTVTYKKG